MGQSSAAHLGGEEQGVLEVLELNGEQEGAQEQDD